MNSEAMNPSDTPPDAEDEKLFASTRKRIRQGFILGTVGYVLITVIVGAALWDMVHRLNVADSQLADVNKALDKAHQDLAETQKLEQEAAIRKAELEQQNDALSTRLVELNTKN